MDFATAFDSVPHSSLWFKLVNSGIHGNILIVLRSMYAVLKSCVKTSEGLTSFFNCHVGTRQGCMLSPFLFVLYIGELLQLLRQAGCLGIFIEESAPNVLILMFADDVSMCADTIGRLKEMILVLEQFCDKWGMKVNLNKTKVMVFRRGDSIRREEVFYFKGKKLEIVSSYKYLGIIFTPKLKWTLATTTLVQQASKAFASLNGCLKRCDGLPFDMAFDLFDKMIAPILFYGSEIWGYQDHHAIEKVQCKFLKRLLGLSQTTSSIAVYGETGRLPLASHYHVRCFKYWLELLSMPDHRYPKRCYLLLKQHDMNGRKNWVSQVREMLLKFDSIDFWNLQENYDSSKHDNVVCIFENRITDYFKKNWVVNLQNSSKLAIYASFKGSFSRENYIVNLKPRKLLMYLARFRTSNHNLEIEIGRHRDKLLSERLCKFCEKMGDIVIEDELHFLLSCEMYSELRKTLLPCIAQHKVNFDLFIELMSTTDVHIVRQLAVFVYEGFVLRKKRLLDLV